MTWADPFDVPTPRQVKPPEPDFRSEFWQQVPDMRPTAPRAVPATMKICRFDHANKRVLHIRPGCPHFPEHQG